MNPDRHAVIYNSKYDNDESVFKSTTCDGDRPESMSLMHSKYALQVFF
jgi:hypothetical protein